jgi:uncharacterized membrane protein
VSYLVLKKWMYFVAGARWLPVVWLQLRMRDMGAAAADQPLPSNDQRYLRIRMTVGIPAFLALLVAFYLMVAKPS